MGIDNAGTIAGGYSDGSGTSHGFIRAADGTIATFNVKGSSSTDIYTINVKGVIAGIYGSETGSGMFAGKP